MLNEARWLVIEKLLQRLIEADFPPDLASDMVTLIDIGLDQPDDTIAIVDQVVEQHAAHLIDIRDRLYTMLRRVMNASKSPKLHLISSLLESMLRNMARQYRISLSA